MKIYLSGNDLQARRPVWAALSEFWLDTELNSEHFDTIASVLAASPYSIAEARDIHKYEVAPVVAWNLLDVAGEWAGFDAELLCERCRQQAEQRNSISSRLRAWAMSPIVWYFTRNCWRQIESRASRSTEGKI